MKTVLKNVIQGQADVFELSGQNLGFVSQHVKGWYAYDPMGFKVNEYPNPKREHAVKELVTWWEEQNER